MIQTVFSTFDKKTWLLSLLLSGLLWSNWVNAAPYERVITLSPHLTEMVYSAGAGSKLVGAIAYSNYPASAKTLPIVGTYNALNLEKIIQLKPDLILAWQSSNQSKVLERLQQLGFKVELFEPRKLSDIPRDIKRIGTLLNTSQIADALANRLMSTLTTVKRQYQELTKIRFFYQIWDDPMMTVNGQVFISQAIETCGAENIFAQQKILAPEVDTESVLKRNPDVILLGGETAVQKTWYQNWLKWPQINAVKNKQIYLINTNHFQRPTARLIHHLPDLCQRIHNARQKH
ncbi:Vitamin B12-binding protein [Hydrogenovibrio crunogenus]|uniref:Vitamin B12-binding protein n=1 Tax=Hydrogenovibrio crunogenus TaxID=39765 RepID=A0A4V1C8T1_9GAMM|nr:cobalamin-binding protein [Hydrogenovibrio crunogenus]QBZ82984.1 Vitamin B12-binding protein [Hydrogenovibrio crunogenus]RUM93281.1 MAG: cobalamin-binding protein [Thiomicrospira sp.]